MKQWGGPTSLAKKLGHSNGSYLAQLAIGLILTETGLI